MPKKYGYMTGGKHPAGPLASYEQKTGSPVDVGPSGAGMGTNYGSPHTDMKNKSGAGGTGSSGRASDSTPSKKK